MTAARARPVAVVAAAYLGWTLDAFDFFLMVFVFRDVAREFHTGLTLGTLTITLTLAMRPLGAFLFGRLGERFGRRPALMASVLGYSVLEFASGLAPGLWSFLALRALFGVAMGGEWGVGAALTMESVPAAWRGRISGLLQAGYPSGYLLATLLYAFAYPVVGWRGLFFIGAAPALLVLFVRARVAESPDWLARRATGRAAAGKGGWPPLKLSLFAVALMTAFNFLSHGTQDLYPTFLLGQRHFDHAAVSAIGVAYTIAAISGGVVCGVASQHVGRRRAIAAAALLCLPAIPVWAYATTPLMVGLGAVLVQFCVQGAWGVVPAHLNEISPPAARATFPGFVYQVGNFLAAGNATIQGALAVALGHDLRLPLAGMAAVMAVAVAVLVWLGPEARDAAMGEVEGVVKRA